MDEGDDRVGRIMGNLSTDEGVNINITEQGAVFRTPSIEEMARYFRVEVKEIGCRPRLEKAIDNMKYRRCDGKMLVYDERRTELVMRKTEV